VLNYTLNFNTTGTVSNLRFNGTMNFVETVDDKGTPTQSDDVATQTGSGSGTVAGVAYTQTVIEDLLILNQAGCEDIYVDGKVLFQLNGHSDEVTDYGDGTCDNIATFEIDGVVRHFYID
jgi:hypothetical protein